MRIVDTLSRLQPGSVPAKKILMADYHSERVPKTPKVQNAIIDKIEDKTSSIEENLEGDLEKIESFIPGHHKTEEKEEEESDSSSFDMSSLESLGNGERGEPKHNFLGYTEFDVLDFMIGFSTGIYQKDVKEEYDTCVLGVPKYAFEMYNISQNIKLDKLNSLEGVEDNFKEIEESFTLIMSMISEAPKELAACKQLYADGSGTLNWIMHHLSPTQMIGNIFGNMATHMVGIATDSWGLIAALMHHDMFTYGKDLAELIMMLIN